MCTRMQDLPFLCESIQMYIDTSICITNCTNATLCIYVYTTTYYYRAHPIPVHVYNQWATLEGLPEAQDQSMELPIQSRRSRFSPAAQDSSLEVQNQDWSSRSSACEQFHTSRHAPAQIWPGPGWRALRNTTQTNRTESLTQTPNAISRNRNGLLETENNF